MKARHSKTGRRAFIGGGMIAGVAVIGASIIQRGAKRTVVMIARDGKLYEVPLADLRKYGVRQLMTKQAMQHWMNSNTNEEKGE